MALTPGQAADITQAAPLLDEVEPDAFIGDKGYDSDALVEKLEQRGITPVIPAKANRKESRETDFALYCERNLVERFFNALKQYRGIATLYDKLANTFLTGVLLEHLTRRLNRLWIHMTARIRFNIPTGAKGPVMNGEALFGRFARTGSCGNRSRSYPRKSC